MNFKKRGMSSIIVYIIMGLFVTLAMIPVIKYTIDTSDSSIAKQYGINTDDKFVPWDYDAQLSDEEKIALQSMDLLTDAINALAIGQDINAEDDTWDDNPLTITYNANFEAETPGRNERFDMFCPYTLYPGQKKSYNCKEYFDNLERLKNKTPVDIERVYSFNVKTPTGKLCGTPDGVYNGQDLKTWDPQRDKDCSASPSYIVCDNFKIYYCGKSGWTITTKVEITSEEDTVHIVNELGIVVFFDYIGNGIKDTANAFGFSTSKVSSAYCDGGKIYPVGNTTMCLRCDMAKNNGKGQCSLEGFELPQKITREEAETWLAGYGDPKYVLYYEQFPQGEDEAWQVSTMSVMSITFVAGSVLEFLPLIGKSAGYLTKVASKIKPLEKAVEATKNGVKVTKETFGKIASETETFVRSVFKKTPNEITTSSVRRAVSEYAIYKNTFVEITDRKTASVLLNKAIVKEELESSGTKFLLDNSLLNEFYTELDDTILKHLDDLGNLNSEGEKFLGEEVKKLYEKYLFDDRNINYLINLPEEDIAFNLALVKGGGIRNPNIYQEFKNIVGSKKYNNEEMTKILKTDDFSYAFNNIKSEVSNVIEKVDYKYAIDDILLHVGLDKASRSFMSLMAGYVSRDGDELITTLDTKKLKETVTSFRDSLSKMPEERQSLLIIDGKNSARHIFTENGQKIDWELLLNTKSSSDKLDALTLQFDTFAKEQDALGMYEGVYKYAGFAKDATWTYKERLALGYMLGAYAAYLDSINEKYTPAGYNTIALSQISVHEPREANELAEEAKDLFIRLDKDGRNSESRDTNRLFFVSPCRTDLDIRKQKCTCAVEDIVENIDGRWIGYLKKTKSGYVPVRNVGENPTFMLRPLNDIDENKYEMPTSDEYSVEVIDYGEIMLPVLNSGEIPYAVKECNTRGFFDSTIFSFNNIDVETECITVSETDIARDKYAGYNDGYNFCYSGDNTAATVLDVLILSTQVGLSFGMSSIPGGIVAVPVVNILLNYGMMQIDEASKWPTGDLLSSTVSKYGDGTVMS